MGSSINHVRTLSRASANGCGVGQKAKNDGFLIATFPSLFPNAGTSKSSFSSF